MNIVLFDSLKDVNRIDCKDRRYSHIVSVLGKRIGDEFKCGVINKGKGMGKIFSLDSSALEFEYSQSDCTDNEVIKLIVILGAVRPICLKRIVRAASECGIYKIILTLPQLAEKSYLLSDYVKTEWRQTAIDGAEQSGNTSLLEFEVIKDLTSAIQKAEADILDKYHAAPSKIILDNKTEFYKKDVSFLQNESIKMPSVVAIGSERGWIDEERDVFTKRGYVPKKISSRILRTETAFITSLFPFLN